MPLNLKQCDGACDRCIRNYVKRHQLKKGDQFEIPCRGIPKEYVPEHLLASIGGDREVIQAMLDPVAWAAHFLDWHCLDADGKHWQRKSLDGTVPTGLALFEEERAALGKSIFHRPYQAEMLRCTSQHKVFRIGRQAGKTEVLCIAVLHSVYTSERFRVVVIAPYESQIELIFDRLNALIDSNIMLANSRRYKRKKPQHKIEFHNGSVIIGFTAGTRSGQEAGASRGQPAHMLVFDEADYLNPGDIDAALATIANFPDATVWMSSTPTGRREAFYSTCRDKLFREFHFPSQCNPNWNENLEKLFRSRLTEDGYKHEVLAEFGEQEEGVYQAKYVEAAQDDYEYGFYKPNKNWHYAIGVDWNDIRTGTTVAVVGFDPANGFFRLVEKTTIARSEMTQLKACQTIAEFNRRWMPFAIYVDRGFGATQIEVLHKFGADALKTEGHTSIDGKLRSIVKPYDFGGTIEVRDLFTKQPVPKRAKPFLVENSVRRFEQYSFKYPRSDEKLRDALLGYIINRVTTSGMPVYEQQNVSCGDHELDAINLALVAFTLEKTEFGQPKYEYGVAFSNELSNILKGGPLDHNKTNRSLHEEAETHRPRGGRSDMMRQGSLIRNVNGSYPAANTAFDRGLKLWSWPGFLQDAPRPRSNSTGEMLAKVERRIFGPRATGRGRPSRTKF